MDALVARQIKKVEADWLGIEQGWYGTKISGTLVTARFATSEECESEIKKRTDSHVARVPAQG
jgi:hypothetical protein